MFTLTKVTSAPPSTSTISNIPITTVGIPCSIPYSLATKGATCNLTEAFASHGYPVPLIQKQLSRVLHHPNSTPCPYHNPVTFPSPLLIIQASTILRGSLEKVSIFFPRTSSANLHLSLTSNPHNPATPNGSRPCN